MLGLGHLPELIVILGVGLLVFGPKRMIDMGAAAGKAFREFREATRDLNLTNLSGLTNPPQSAATAEPDPQSTLSKLSQLSQSLSASPSATGEVSAPTSGASATVDGTISHVEDHSAEPTKAE
jgi:sec-independent protein translocase protein TatA